MAHCDAVLPAVISPGVGFTIGRFGSCIARLQAGILESSRCPPEGGRYKCEANFQFSLKIH